MADYQMTATDGARRSGSDGTLDLPWAFLLAQGDVAIMSDSERFQKMRGGLVKVIGDELAKYSAAAVGTTGQIDDASRI